ncbi:Nucleoid occlusion protein [Rhizobium rhizogenes]|uniref:Nucleoid occlusion protein n=1 Tax=Rhizobium rhizogenes TaxID=359 RepID=A0AAN2DF23_RHIRH|nr:MULTISPECIES: plasmid partitioning protein RepB [Rhizobium/Agrobacterium group]AQS64270.1 plasmid partitioning protein RepB [Rhizobium rhizogenes]MCZ7441324.1 plasmid partitioning protein RepB [Rhizobium rhizogenes]NSZ81344.1 plasmid partitioning protein RepB [Agrobacterium tumefaciens]OAM62292.1 plasmid partitioning protein RepB [Rhizobium rhizogenes]CAD0215702.1 Nucleoid occlusion protein [Rhizobium rhizogenes]
MSRKQIFANLGTPGTDNSDAAPERARPRIRPILGSPELVTDVLNSPVGMIGQSLNEVSERAKRAEEIEKRLAEGLTIVSLNPADIDPSFIPDRMPASEEADAGLVEAIREQGQQVPILVRPHPEFQGRYQVAFGHRRLRAVSSLGIPVKAVVRDLSDEQLVVAQGQENNERRDLTYIEKARFAQKLQMRFPRDTIMAAMSLHKGDLSNMLSVVGRIPEDLVDLIGPAPSVGRRNWMDLADQLSSSQVKEASRAYVKDASVAALPSEERFKSLLDFLKPKAQAKKTGVWSSETGNRLAKVVESDRKLDISIDKNEAPEFADFVLEHLQALFAEYRSKQ